MLVNMYIVMLIKLQSIKRSSEMLVMRLILSMSQRAENKRKTVSSQRMSVFKAIRSNVSISI